MVSFATEAVRDGNGSSRPTRLDWRSAAVFAAVLAFFLISGATGLLYQVVWTRKLVLLFGTTAYAVSTVLSIFFMGLGLGSFWGGRLADRIKRPMRAYAVMELIIGAWALLFITVIDSAEGLLASVLSLLTFSKVAGVVMRSLLAFAFLIVPVFFMGATLPLLAKFVAGTDRTRGFRIGSLYGINTVGAVVGCALTGFFFIAEFGYTRTTFVGVFGNALIGGLAFLLSRVTESPGRRATEAGAETEGEAALVSSALSEAHRRLVILAFALSGFAALALEVLWTRLLAVLFLGTTYAFTTMLTTVLCGIALGSLVASALADRSKHHVSLLGTVEILIGIACIATLGVFGVLPDSFQEMQLDAGYDWEKLVRVKFIVSFAVLIAPTFLFGATFPIVVKAVTGAREGLGKDVGRLYSANTLGGVAGALLGGYFLIPVLGTHYGIMAMAFVCLSIGVVLLWSCPTRSLLAKAALSVAALPAVWVAMQSAPHDVGRTLNEWFLPDGHRIVFYAEGVEATVVVSEPAHERQGANRVLWINAVQATASIEKGVKMNRLQGILPLLFDREPKQALFMCFGSGVTAGTLALSDFSRIDAVEISRDVLAAGVAFKKDNFDVLHNPKVSFRVDDGRNFLLTTKEKYDLITFEPMPLALAGVSTFYTKEYYELCRRRLNPRGIVSQWVPIHSLNGEIVRSLIYTFTSVFPHYCVWFTNADLFILGSDAPFQIDYARAKERVSVSPLRESLIDVGLGDLPEILTSFFMTKENVDRYAEGGTIMTDDRPWAEFVAPKLIYERHVAETLAELQPYYQSPLEILGPESFGAEDPALIRAALDRRYRAHAQDLEGLMLYYGGAVASTPEVEFRKSLEIDGDDYNAKYYLTEILQAKAALHVRWNEPETARVYLEEAIRYTPTRGQLHLMLGDIYDGRGEADEARAYYESFLALGGAKERVPQWMAAPKGTER